MGTGGAREVSIVAAATLAAALASGCTPVSAGQTGIEVDAQGRLVGHVQVCEKNLRIFGLDEHERLTEEERRTATYREPVDAGSWTAPDAVRSSATWLLEGDPQWSTGTELAPLRDDRSYTLSGRSDDGWSVAHGPAFTTEDLARLEPGQVLWGEDRITTVAEFEAQACVGG